MEENEILERLEAAISNTVAPKANSASSVYQMMMTLEPDRRGWFLKAASEMWDEFNGGGIFEPEIVLNQDQINNALQKFGELSDSVLNSLIAQECSEEEFYNRLIDAINSPIFPTDASRIVALYNILRDAQMPYFEIGEGMKMNNDKYANLQRELRTEMKRLSHLLARKFTQRTEQASHVLDVIQSIETRDGQVVAISKLVGLIDRGTEYARRLHTLEARDKSD